MIMVKEKANKSMAQNKQPRRRLTSISSTVFDKEAKHYKEANIVSLTNGAGTIGHPHGQVVWTQSKEGAVWQENKPCN